MHSSRHGPGHEACNGPRHDAARLEWRRELPAAWWGLVDAPASFEIFEEYEMAAERTIGRDEHNEPCYCALRYELTELRSDDDDLFYEAPTYAESLIGWRLHDRRWLTLRNVIDDFELGTMRSFLTFSASMPR